MKNVSEHPFYQNCTEHLTMNQVTNHSTGTRGEEGRVRHAAPAPVMFSLLDGRASEGETSGNKSRGI